MQRRGFTAKGTQRWYCKFCEKSGLRKRPDTLERHRRRLFRIWLTGNRSLAEISRDHHVSRRTLTRWFKPLVGHRPAPPKFESAPLAVYCLDGVYLSGRENAALICRTLTSRISWMFVVRESFASWVSFLETLQAPDAVVIDGQKGLLAAVSALWPQAKVQRCLVHIERLARIRLTRNPKTQTGRELFMLVRGLFDVRTKRDRMRWLRAYRRWEHRHTLFLKERSHGEPQEGRKRRWWYTHRNIRAARSLLRNALPHLFTFIDHPEIPRNTNQVEGGINSRLKELIHRHRGLSLARKQDLVAEYLALRGAQKPPRNVP
jgi:AraC-like DNA-binding protein